MYVQITVYIYEHIYIYVSGFKQCSCALGLESPDLTVEAEASLA